MARGPSLLHVHSARQWSGLTVAVGTALMVAQDLSWLGEWDETGNALLSSGLLGGMLASLIVALDAHRNGRALHALRGIRPPRRRAVTILAEEVLHVLVWPLLGLTLVAGTCYAATAGTNPSPTHISLLVPLVGGLVVSIQVLAGHVLGSRAHLAVALPALVLLGFAVPAAVGSLDHPVGRLSPVLSLWLGLPGIPSAPYFTALAVLYLCLAALFILVLADRMRLWSRVTASVCIIALGGGAATALLTGPGPTADLRNVTRMECQRGEIAEVCVFPDHQRALPQLVQAADQVDPALPEEMRPARYVEYGLAATANDAIVLGADPQGVPAEDIVNAIAQWQVCDLDLASLRYEVIAVRAGFTPDASEAAAPILNLPEAEQITWWRDGKGAGC